MDQQFLADIDNQYLRTSFESQLNAGLTASYVYNTQRNKLDGTSTLVRANLETSGNLLQGVESLFSHHAEGKDYYEIFGIRYSQYVRADVNLSHTEDLGNKMALAGRLFAGVGVTYGNSRGRSIPFDRMFYCGGANSMRGWVPRTLGPGSVTSMVNTLYPAQVGDMRLEANLEFRFLYGISSTVLCSLMQVMCGICANRRPRWATKYSVSTTSTNSSVSTLALDCVSTPRLSSCAST